ncbi:hypothetical protein DAI22_04g146000 [Oryza sativa Japonica Group]|uniref:cDNA clone:002-174-F05, full insert sequence n=1 Tax=Oryza sativa subsp. japonica TaxID=39947 RepID=B7F3C1_ORYSJ|nr:hypothetical protein DAI22_04g146000 [Oryza sativa Japonica Group]BAG99118.1 unnamed protein product [Oryza sativa Japonica Group]
MVVAAAQDVARRPRPRNYRCGLRRLASRWTTSPSTALAGSGPHPAAAPSTRAVQHRRGGRGSSSPLSRGFAWIVPTGGSRRRGGSGNRSGTTATTEEEVGSRRNLGGS